MKFSMFTFVEVDMGLVLHDEGGRLYLFNKIRLPLTPRERVVHATIRSHYPLTRKRSPINTPLTPNPNPHISRRLTVMENEDQGTFMT